MRPNMKSLEEIVSNLPEGVPNDLILLGSYALVARIFLEKGINVDLYRETKDIDLYMFPEDEDVFIFYGNYTQPFTGHYEVSVNNFVAELFSETSYSDLVGENYSEILDFLKEKDEDGKYKHLTKLNLSNRTLYVPNLSAIILMKTISSMKRGDKDRNDLAFIRGYLPTHYNLALNYLKSRETDYKFIKEVLECHKEMFNITD